MFWGDLDHKFRSFDTDSGNILWEATPNDPVQNSIMTDAVNGKQYVAVLTGMGLSGADRERRPFPAFLTRDTS